MSTVAAAPPARNAQRARIEAGPEILNAWAWLLNRAPRVAKAVNDTPGAAKTVADIMAGFDLFHRRYGLTDKRQYAEVERDVSYNEATDIIIVRQHWRH
jgi:transposase